MKRIFRQVLCDRKESGEKFPPKVILRNGQPATERDLYGGCLLRKRHFSLQDPMPLVETLACAILLQVMKLEDGERFGAAVKTLDVAEEDEMDVGGDFGGDDDGDDF